MKANPFILSLIILLGTSLPLFSQSCLPDGITFSTQAEIDNFQTNYPGCTEIEGDVRIEKPYITNLNGLNIITSIGGNLTIGDPNWASPTGLTSLTGLEGLISVGGDLTIIFNYALLSLTGLQNVTFVGGNVRVEWNNTLTSLTGLQNVTYVGGGMRIALNEVLVSLTGLENITSIGDEIVIYNNHVLTSLTGLSALSSLGGGLDITDNDALLSLTGLEGITSLGGWHYIRNLTIVDNDALTSLTGVENIDAESINYLFIYDNKSLSICEVKSVCDYLSQSNVGSQIHNNATGCSSQDEVLEACWFGLDENINQDYFSIFPNPLYTSAILEYNLKEPVNVSLTVYNHLGQQIETLVNNHQQPGKHQTVWNAQGLPAGIYFYRLQAGNQFTSGKVTVVK